MPQTIHNVPSKQVIRGFRESLAPHKGDRLSKWVNGWLLGGQNGLGAAGKQFASSVDPRTKNGAIGLASMFLPGKGGAEDALAAHLGHSEFRPYHAAGYHEGMYKTPDQVMHGGAMPGGGADLGYTNANMANFQAIHGYSLPELLGLVTSKRVVGPRGIKDPRGFLNAPYKFNKNLHN